MTQERRYLIWLASCALGAMLALGCYNAVVDPYSFFNLVSIRGFNAYKTYGLKLRLLKPVHIYQRQPEILIMGSSRGGHLRCDYLTADVEHCYNASLRGITPYEEYRLVEHAIAMGKVKRIVWKLSYATFAELDELKEGLDEDNLAHEDEGATFALRKKIWQRYLYSLFSWEALSDSRDTVYYQDKPFGWFATDIWSFEPDGSWRTYPAARVVKDPHWYYAQHRKHWGLSAGSMVSQLTRLGEVASSHPAQFDRNEVYFAKALAMIYRHHIQLDILFSPEHASYLQLEYETGLWPYAEAWKKRIITLNEQAARDAQQPAARVWDFGGFNEYSTEPTWEALQEGQAMQWFEDIVHFNEALGKKMFEAINHDPEPNRWYAVVDSRNIDEHLKAVRVARDNYLRGRAPIRGNGDKNPADKSGGNDAL